MKRREALVYNTPDDHVTKDIRDGIAKLGGLRFNVLDSAGIETEVSSGTILGRTTSMTANVLSTTQFAILIIDVRCANLQIIKSQRSMTHSEVVIARRAVEEGRGLLVIGNKMDCLRGKQNSEMYKKIKEAVTIEVQTLFGYSSGIPVVFISALEGRGRLQVMNEVIGTYKRWCSRLSTGRLNRWLIKICDEPTFMESLNFAAKDQVFHSGESSTADFCGVCYTLKSLCLPIEINQYD
ncbi:unnamed protein product [Thlaspi arvense]|uniref:G domain-containing protein n=1 Tax=Thlaspi arvense TaxID=13288 RepID=A0AAU9T6T7_THLAR|nr:unnamed protein product [Thlaspi arvense]